ncbi:hypothetical protein IKF63_01480 [Candidatus Saccharibacteria bacterium]|nr:hypothetical protein [Candidatus Saccharibacteria bacterium]
MEPKKTLVKKKSKKPLIITIVIVVILLAGGLLGYFFFFKKAPKIVLSDSEYLIQTKSWEKVDAPTVIWVFDEGGKGELTTNKSNYYNMTWLLEGKTLKIDTDWLYELNDSFDVTIDRDNSTFTVVNLSDNTESVFVPLGSRAQETSTE